MRMEHVVVALIIALVVLLALSALSATVIPSLKQGLDNIAVAVGIKA